MNIDRKKLGTQLDSWSDLLDGQASYRDALEGRFAELMAQRQIPSVNVEPGTISFGFSNRPYNIASHKEGAKLNIAFRQYGNDLYIGWDLWFCPQWNILMCLIFLAACCFFGLGLIMIVLGYVLKGRWDGLLRTSLDYFTYEDTKALTFAVDHCLRSAANEVGLKINLRERSSFLGEGAGAKRLV